MTVLFCPRRPHQAEKLWRLREVDDRQFLTFAVLFQCIGDCRFAVLGSLTTVQRHQDCVITLLIEAGTEKGTEKVEQKMCQEPFFGFLGRPWGRTVDSKPKRRIVRLLHSSPPNGLPRWTAASSAGVSGVFTWSSQLGFRGNGQPANTSLSGADPCSQWYRLPQRHCSARRTSFARAALRST